MFLNNDLKNYNGLFLLAFRIIQRLAMLIVAVYFKFPLLQLVSFLYIQTVFTLYVLLVMPMEDTVDNQTLVFNELVLTTICVLLF